MKAWQKFAWWRDETVLHAELVMRVCYMQVTYYTWVYKSVLHAEHMLHMVHMSVYECVTCGTQFTLVTHECVRVCYIWNAQLSCVIMLHAYHMLHMSVCKCVIRRTYVTLVTHECLRVCYMRNAQLSFSSGDPLEVTWRASMNSLKMEHFVDDKNMKNDIVWRFIVKNGISGSILVHCTLKYEQWICIKFKRLILY